MTEQEFKDRTKNIALRVIRLVETLPPSNAAQVIGKQILRSATSIGANYRAACRGKSTADVLHKLSIVEEEADESMYWIELLIDAEIVPENKLCVLQSDINEIVAMTVSSIKTLRSRKLMNPKSKIQNPKYD
jgi:four helix bundle protein